MNDDAEKSSEAMLVAIEAVLTETRETFGRSESQLSNKLMLRATVPI